MNMQIGAPPAESLLDDPLALFYACHRRVEFFLNILLNVTQASQGRTLTFEQQNALKPALRYFREAAPLHTLDEEQSLFPRLQKIQYQNKKTLLHILETLKQGHHQAEDDHKKVEQCFKTWLDLGQLSAKMYAGLSETLKRLSDFYEAHIQAEEREVFPIAQKALSPADIIALGREMAIRRGLDPDALYKVTAQLKQGHRPA
ncbi:hemerythrin domain-containing protein [Nitrospira defluvii]|nr:hemerythrin domain-containing protein [Nitrospira defluvii]